MYTGSKKGPPDCLREVRQEVDNQTMHRGTIVAFQKVISSRNHPSQ